MGLEAQATMLGSTLVEFKVDYENNQHLAIGDGVHSDAIAVGGHMWRMNCYPFGVRERDKGEHVSFFLELLNKSSTFNHSFPPFNPNHTFSTAQSFSILSYCDA
nr:unnamed protein product [Digitaria exilis]